MGVMELKRELAKLPPEDRREVAAFLVALRHDESGDFKDRLSAMIDDKDPANWMTLEEFDKKQAPGK